MPPNLPANQLPVRRAPPTPPGEDLSKLPPVALRALLIKRRIIVPNPAHYYRGDGPTPQPYVEHVRTVCNVCGYDCVRGANMNQPKKVACTNCGRFNPDGMHEDPWPTLRLDYAGSKEAKAVLSNATFQPRGGRVLPSFSPGFRD